MKNKEQGGKEGGEGGSEGVWGERGESEREKERRSTMRWSVKG